MDILTGKKKQSFYLPEDTLNALDAYASINYKPSEMYGAASKIVSGAIISYCCAGDTDNVIGTSFTGVNIRDEEIDWDIYENKNKKDDEEDV